MKRLFDVAIALFLLILALPLFVFMTMWVMIDDGAPVFFSQTRVGKNQVNFRLHKFRTMKRASEQSGQLTVGSRDKRITASGYYLRKYKIDELPQLWNVLKGDMSLVGPRPEVPKYVSLYTNEQKRVLSVKPGITDHASLLFFDESELLANSKNPEEVYVQQIMPQKLGLNLEYIDNQTLKGDFSIIIKTISRIFSGH
jgi:lipopolysaccharide/colanic/teichoic acid biosynthesis glycosyltransferase